MSDEWKEINAGVNSYWGKEGTIQGVLVDKVDSSGQYNSSLYTLKEANGETVGVNGTTVIDSKLKNVALGAEVRITALGEAKSEKSGRTYNDFKVEVREVPFAEVKEETAHAANGLDDNVPL